MWITRFLTSSIGKKWVMSLTGLFLIVFLLVHLSGNLSIFYPDAGKTFNIYADFMANNPIIGTIGFGLYAMILIHAIQGVLLSLKNKKAKGQAYAKRDTQGSWASKNMALLGILILAFLFIHMGDFWWKVKWAADSPIVAVDYGNGEIGNLYERVVISFSKPWIVISYIVGLIGLAFHLWHGFESAFQTLGLNHKKYTPLISGLGKLYSILIPLGYATMPLYILFFKS